MVATHRNVTLPPSRKDGAMYHTIVRRHIRSLFEAITRGDAESVLVQFIPRFEHVFLGNHALGGLRRPHRAAGTSGSIACCST